MTIQQHQLSPIKVKRILNHFDVLTLGFNIIYIFKIRSIGHNYVIVVVIVVVVHAHFPDTHFCDF